MIDEPLAEAFVHRRHTVMWRRLRPLSLRHFFALLIIGSPLLDQGRDVTWADLEAAVTICALRDPVRALNRLPRHRSLRGRLLRRLWPAALEYHARAFEAYIRDYHAVPESAESQGGQMARAPWILRMVHTFMRNGYTEAAAWQLPTGEAFHRYPTLVELDGGEVPLIDPEEKELLTLAREALAARDANALTPEPE